MQSRQHANLSREPLAALRSAKLAMQDLERNRAIMAQIASAVHGGHATAAELSLDRVSTGEWCVRVRDRVVHASRPGSRWEAHNTDAWLRGARAPLSARAPLT